MHGILYEVETGDESTNPMTLGSPLSSAADFPCDLKYLLSQYVLSLKQPLLKTLLNKKFYLQFVL